MLVRYDKKYKFKSMFDPNTGFYMRTGVLDENGEDTGVDPFMSSFPELIDVGIMGSCKHGRMGLCVKAGIECYQGGLNVFQSDMTMEDFERIVRECSGKTYQFALGGRGDPDQHNDFVEMVKLCRENNIVPNFTTSGIGMTDEIAKVCKRYCGAVAVSWYRSEHTLSSIDCLIRNKVKTNIHYVLSNHTIDEAIERLQSNSFPAGINAVIFLLHKPVGLGKKDNVLQYDDPKVRQFFQMIDSGKFPYKIGFDSCSIPAILNFTNYIDEMSIDTCEGARWSMYITPDMIALPCSFDNQDLRWGYSLHAATIEEAWNSKVFEDFRNYFRNSCPECSKREFCMGGCPISEDIVLCKKRGVL